MKNFLNRLKANNSKDLLKKIDKIHFDSSRNDKLRTDIQKSYTKWLNSQDKEVQDRVKLAQSLFYSDNKDDNKKADKFIEEEIFTLEQEQSLLDHYIKTIENLVKRLEKEI